MAPLLTLPHELHAHIIHAALPTASALHHAHLARYTLLRSFALVSRAWAALAQPLLHAKVYLPQRPALALLARTLDARADLARAMRVLEVHAHRRREASPDAELERVFELAGGVQRVFLGAPGEVDLGVLRHMPDLRELAIYGGRLLAPSAPLTLAHLSHVSLCGTHLSASPALSAFFTPATLPALAVTAHAFSPTPLSLGAFPAALRLVCTAPLPRPFTPETAPTTLLWTRHSAPQAALLGLSSAAQLARVEHLRLSDVHARSLYGALLAWLYALPGLKTLRVPLLDDPRDPTGWEEEAEFWSLCMERGVRVLVEEEDEGEDAFEWMTVVPREWR